MRRLCVSLTCVLAMTACGSTVAVQGSAQVPGAGGLGGPVGSSGGPTGQVPAAGGSTGATTAPGGVGPASTTGATAFGSTGAATGGSVGGTTGAGPAGRLPVGPGVTATTVNVGIVYSSANAGNVGAQFGAKNLVYGDLLAEQQAVFDYVNAHGGAGGRRLVPVAYDAATSTSGQAVCAAWTQDHKVFAGIYPGGQVPSADLASCMAKHRSMYVTAPFVPGDAEFMRSFGPYYWTPRSLEAVTMGRVYVEGLAAQGFYEGKHKLGLIYYDIPALRAALDKGVRPALRARGIAQPETYAISYPQGQSEYAAGLSAMQNAVLKFKTQGIDRVMFLDAGAALCFFFTTDAQSQGYHPRMGLESGSNPAFIAQNFDKDTLAGTVGMGWIPPGDVDAAGIPDTAARRLCRSIMSKAGQEPQSPSDLLAQYDMCATIFFLKAALDHALTPEIHYVESALSKLTSLPEASASSLGDGYGPDKHWGVRSYRTLRYVEGCSCFRYTGSDRHV